MDVQLKLFDGEPIANCQFIAMAQDLRGMTNKELAQATGIKTRLIGEYRYGKKPCYSQHLEKIAEVLHFPVSFFLREGEYLSPYYRLPKDDKPLREQCHELLERVTDDDLYDTFEFLDDMVGLSDQERAAYFRQDGTKPPIKMSPLRHRTFMCGEDGCIIS